MPSVTTPPKFADPQYNSNFHWDQSEDEAVNYDDYEWFKDEDRPKPSQPSPQTTFQDSYIPSANVVEDNERFMFALKHAPNILYGRFKQYGQLGVLGWCSEFSELIDNLKELGFAGNMFQTTRSQALKTCEEILSLPLQLKMQIIVMYLSSQVARLRRFLDGEREFNDYPKADFPVETMVD